MLKFEGHWDKKWAKIGLYRQSLEKCLEKSKKIEQN